MEILKIKDLLVGFDIKKNFYPVLYSVDMNINKGETFALVGESGCGKTMTAMSIINLLPKNAKIVSGQIFLNSENLLDYSEKQMQKIRGRKISLIPQDPMTSLNPLFTVKNQVKEVVEMNSDLRGKEADKKVIELFDLVKIPNAKNVMNLYPHEFSGGMKQRAIISMALACKAELIIADEPTTALDATIQLQIMNLLDEIKKNFSTSILLISHDLGLVSNFSQNCAVMYSGRIVEQAETKELLNNPQHPYTQALIQALPDFKNSVLKTIDGQPPSIFENIDGCSFSPRCEYSKEICRQKIPCMKNISSTHCVRCWER